MTERFKNVFDALSDSPEEAVNLKLRAELIREIRHKIEDSGWTQSLTAEKLNVSQPRVSDLLNGKISKFSLDSLVNMMATLGGEISLEVA
jgi:predicted XRE-type DNA-binding protein